MSSPSSDTPAPEHHPVIRAQQPVTMLCPANFALGFLGMNTRLSFYVGIPAEGNVREARVLTTCLPPIDESYFEWVDVLESVAEATDTVADTAPARKGRNEGARRSSRAVEGKESSTQD